MTSGRYVLHFVLVFLMVLTVVQNICHMVEQLMNTGLLAIWTEAIISYFKVLYQHSLRGTVNAHKKILACINGVLAETEANQL
jgi:hypothetical protein